jgi:hypothetical protein
MRALLTALALAALAALAPAAAAAPTRFDVGILDPGEPAFAERDMPGAYDALRSTNLRVVRVPVAWSVVAKNRPASPTDPKDPAYTWSHIDTRVQAIRNRGLEPLLSLYATPGWGRTSTQYGSTRITPDPKDFANFTAAAARHYDGSTPGIPAVRNWQLWNEPNLSTYLDPSDAVEQYRAMVNAAYPAIKGISAANRVVAGGTAPYAYAKDDIGPLRFVRELLCMSAASKPKPTCETKVTFDAWSHHPYTTGGPNHSAAAPDDVSLGDLPEMKRVLRAAEKAGHVKPAGPLDFWVTEFSWDTKGPDPDGVPLARHARWVAEAFYNMWRSDVSLAVWFQLRDNPKGNFTWGQTWQSGLFFKTTDTYAKEQAKPFRQVMRFPFVAVPSGKGARAWGRSPTNRKATVLLERKSGKRWLRITKLTSNANGLFDKRIAVKPGSLVRARVGSESAVPFKVERTKDVRVHPFGGTGQ